ncbi:MAG: glutamine-hydrolyzing GMP synthase [Nitrospirae bacterium]|nr:MAG: glutamine-hydrolyzing GMP synthase [Nitrospirota bacterium]
METSHDTIVILDFGSQYTQLIARRIREAQVHSLILPASASLATIRALHPKGLIFSGGPASVMDETLPSWPQEVLDEDLPILGICYGMQLLAHVSGGIVSAATRREFGRAELTVLDRTDLFRDLPSSGPFPVWMSHGDRIESLPPGFVCLARTPNSPVAAMKYVQHGKRWYCLQFHPEVAHTTYGPQILRNFLFTICGCRPTWTMRSFLEHSVEQIRARVQNKRVFCALSGGVDSAVAAVMTYRAVGKQLTCVFIDNGLLRKDEAVSLPKLFAHYNGFECRVVDARDSFLRRLRGVADPEKKRRIIGRQFIRVFETEAQRVGDVTFLVQGTLYPDVIESVSAAGPSATIKTHHNVGGLPSRMKLQLIEPLRELFKDEVRVLGRELGLPEELIARQPFPGPGLAIRILGPVTSERLDILREADAIVREELAPGVVDQELWQAFAVLLPIRTVGVMGDRRTYEHVIALRVVTSVDGMTADWAKLPYEVLERVSNRLINEVAGVNRVVYDISSKPPSTIEWE